MKRKKRRSKRGSRQGRKRRNEARGFQKDREAIEGNQRSVYPVVAWRTSGSRPDCGYADPEKILRSSGSRPDCGSATPSTARVPADQLLGQTNGNVGCRGHAASTTTTASGSRLDRSFYSLPLPPPPKTVRPLSDFARLGLGPF